MYVFKCGDESKEIKRISKISSEDNKFEEFEKCLDGENYQKECDNYISKSINPEMYLQKIKKVFIIYFR